MAWDHANDGFYGEWDGRLGCFVYPTNRFKTVTFYAFWIRNLEPDGRALGALLPHVLKRGTESHPSRLLMEQTLENLYGASFRAEVGKLGDKQLMTFQLSVIHGQYLPGQPDTVQQGLDFLADVLDHPYLVSGRFLESWVNQEKVLVTRQIAALINDKGQYALTRLIEEMAQGRPFGLRKWGTPKDVEAVDAEALTTFYHHMHQMAPLVVLAVGDVDPVKVDQYVRERFGVRQRVPVGTIEPYYPLHQGREVIDREEVRQGKLQLGYATRRTAGHPEYPALMMYSGILGGFSHSKLFLNVREKASLAYYAYSRIDPALALMVVGAGIEFTHYQAARDIIEAQLEAMRQGDFTEEEMAFTVKAFENDILSEEDSPGQLMARRLEHLLIGGGLSGIPLIEALKRVTRDDIVRVAQDITLDTVYFLTAKEAIGHGAQE
ncbi:MAG: pitrilysin family protein [Sulfobacillus sp.]|nr:pitrilysin family protein [Sulfobacillus sp.]